MGLARSTYYYKPKTDPKLKAQQDLDLRAAGLVGLIGNPFAIRREYGVVLGASGLVIQLCFIDLSIENPQVDVSSCGALSIQKKTSI